MSQTGFGSQCFGNYYKLNVLPNQSNKKNNLKFVFLTNFCFPPMRRCWLFKTIHNFFWSFYICLYEILFSFHVDARAQLAGDRDRFEGLLWWSPGLIFWRENFDIFLEFWGLINIFFNFSKILASFIINNKFYPLIVCNFLHLFFISIEFSHLLGKPWNIGPHSPTFSILLKVFESPQSLWLHVNVVNHEVEIKNQLNWIFLEL